MFLINTGCSAVFTDCSFIQDNTSNKLLVKQSMAGECIFVRCNFSSTITLYTESNSTYKYPRLSNCRQNGVLIDDYPLKRGGSSVYRQNHLTAPFLGFSFYDSNLNKPIFWNGSAWVDANGETVGLQVSDTSVLIGAAADSSKTVSLYYSGSTAPTITVLNSDDSTNTWLTATLANNTLTLTASANTTSAPRGAKVLVTLGDELIIINVVQSY